jgi:hypothetical protein
MLSSGAIFHVALTALSAMAKIFLVSVVGILASKYPKGAPLLPPLALRTLSRLSNLVLLPALMVASLGSALSVAMLQRMAILILFCILTNLVSYSFAFTVGKILHEDDPVLSIATSVAIGSPNAISFPLMVMQTLCDEPLVSADDYAGKASLCIADANSMLFVYSIGWHVMFWSYGWTMLKTLVVDKHQQRETTAQIVSRMILSPSMLAIYLGIFIGIIGPIRNAMFRDFTVLRPLGSALKTLGDPVVCLNCLVMSANLAQIDLSPVSRLLTTASSWFSSAAEGSVFDKETTVHELVSVSSPLHNSVAESAAEAEAAVAVEKGDPSPPPLPQFCTILSFILCRLVLTPLVMVPVIRLAADGQLIGSSERLMQLVCIIESAAPSAQLVVVSLTQLGHSRAASQMAFLYVFQYASCIITVTAWTSAGMSLVYS